MCYIIKILNNCFLFQNVFYSCDGKAEFSAAIIPVFIVTWFLKKYFNMQNMWNRDTFFSSGFFNEQYLFELKYFLTL